jgi:C_GCAxxG_C_C family probable redox protein
MKKFFSRCNLIIMFDCYRREPVNICMKNEIIKSAQSLFDEGYACSQSILLAFADVCLLDKKTAALISSTFGGGMGRLRQKCGALTGSFMVLGLKYGNVVPTDMDTKLNSYEKVRELNRQFEEKFGATDCAELLRNTTTESEVEQRKHHAIICRKLVGETAGMLCDMLEVK